MGHEQGSNIVYIDESGMKNSLKNEYAWSPRGESVRDETKGRATEKLNIVAGLSGGEIVARMTCECGMKAKIKKIADGIKSLSVCVETIFQII